ncbi:MAG: glutamine synthetase beta-grasp domain-containing protein [Saprospiraceae bacterium]
MAKFKFEYIWRDGYKPEANFRGKTKVIEMESFDGDVNKLPEWSFDGSSTKQAEGHFSDLILKPKRVYPDPERKQGYLVLCEVYNPDGTPHVSNTRNLVADDGELWIGFEQEYVIMSEGRPLGFPKDGYPAPQGQYYCAVGKGNVEGREFVEEHMDQCLAANIDITGINAEVMLGQWEFQVFVKGSLKACDDLMISRYLLHKLGEYYDYKIDIHPKPVKGDWNGSGMHTNFSTELMRAKGGKDMMSKICTVFGEAHAEHIKVYGAYNDQRLTGLHETQSIDTFSYGVSDRGASVRIPSSTATTWTGYLEDRRPASNADPYLILSTIQKTLKKVDWNKF